MVEDMITDIFLETITACNRRCSYCPNSRSGRGSMQNLRKIDEELFFKIIDDLADISTLTAFAPHFYGEPLLDPRLSGLLYYVRSRLPRVDIALFTNGDFLTLRRYLELVESGVNRFVLSEHGPEMVPKAQKIIQHRQEYGDGGVDLEIQLFQKGRNLFTRGGLIGTKNSEGFIRMTRCCAPSNVVIIDYQGNVVLCCNDYFSTVTFGNLRERSLSEIWEDREYAGVRKELRNGIFQLPICQDCGTIPLEAGWAEDRRQRTVRR